MRATYFFLSMFSLMVACGFIFNLAHLPTLFALGGPGLIGLSPANDFLNGISLTSVNQPQPYEQSASWNAGANDYLTFTDSTSVPGFRVNVYMSSTDLGRFVYSGSSEAQPNLSPDNLRLYGGYSVSGAVYEPASAGVDDSTKTLSLIASESCVEAEDLDNYSFNSALNTGDYGLVMSSGPQLYLVGEDSGQSCKAVGRVKIKRMVLNYPDGSNVGGYSSILVFLMVDGAN